MKIYGNHMDKFKDWTWSGWWFHPLFKNYESLGIIVPNIWKITFMFQIPKDQPVSCRTSFGIENLFRFGGELYQQDGAPPVMFVGLKSH